jgi:hypothetical protein
LGEARPKFGCSAGATAAYAGAGRVINEDNAMNRNGLYLVVGLLVIAAVAVGYLIYQEEQKSGVDIKIGDGGISIEER